eukprot:7120768-Prymnesium_polylepis.1
MLLTCRRLRWRRLGRSCMATDCPSLPSRRSAKPSAKPNAKPSSKPSSSKTSRSCRRAMSKSRPWAW